MEHLFDPSFSVPSVPSVLSVVELPPRIGQSVALRGKPGTWTVVDVDHDRGNVVVVPDRECWCDSHRLVPMESIEPWAAIS